MLSVQNPFRPSAGQSPLYLAGRDDEQSDFSLLLDQNPILQNCIITGLRGVGKTVLLENLKPIAVKKGWLWTGNDLSESVSLTEERVATRVVTDLSALLGPIVMKHSETMSFGFAQKIEKNAAPLTFADLWQLYETTPGLTTDKLKAVIEAARTMLVGSSVRGIIFCYDEAQNLSDHAADREYPLSVLLDVFSALQKDHSKTPIMLVLSGLPTLFPRLNEARTYTERMFRVTHLNQLDRAASELAITKPLEISESPLMFSPDTVDGIVSMSGGYPFFLQYIGKEVFDAWISRIQEGGIPSVDAETITNKLDMDFFSPRWERATARQQEFMSVIACLEASDSEFTAQEIANESKDALQKKFSPSHAIQMLQTLSDKGLVYKSKYGKYCFAVPLMAAFIRRQATKAASVR